MLFGDCFVAFLIAPWISSVDFTSLTFDGLFNCFDKMFALMAFKLQQEEQKSALQPLLPVHCPYVELIQHDRPSVRQSKQPTDHTFPINVECICLAITQSYRFTLQRI